MKCTRCEGNKKIVLFSSVENPCQRCKGSGLEPSSDDGSEEHEESPKDYIEELQKFFRQEVGRDLRSNEYSGSVFISHPKASDISDLVSDFTYVFRNKTQGINPLTLINSSRPMAFYRRAQGQSNQIQRSSIPYKLKSSWNRPSNCEQPYSSVIILAKDPIIYAEYLIWEP